jgi:hypothetical protein
MACLFGIATPNSPAKEYAKDGWWQDLSRCHRLNKSAAVSQFVAAP